MGTALSNLYLDPLGFGNTKIEQKFKNFEKNFDLKGLSVAITGANAGLGFATAKRLAANGARVIMLCRDLKRAEEAKAKIQGDVSILQVNMVDYESIMNLKLSEVDVLIHNAGALFDQQRFVKWPSGELDETFALHVAGPYLLSSRVKAKYTIWVSSGGMYGNKLKVKPTLSPPAPFNGVNAYSLCKRAQVVIAKRLGHQSMHPGWTDTEGVQTALPSFYEKRKRILRTLDEGADTIVWLAAKRPTQIGFWFDREIVTKYKFPCTSHSKKEENELMNEMERVIRKQIEISEKKE